MSKKCPENELDSQNNFEYDFALDSNDYQLISSPLEDLSIDSEDQENLLYDVELESNENSFDFELKDIFPIQVETGDYNKLYNKPSIESIILQGDITLQDLNLKNIYYMTTAEWSLTPNLVSQEGAIYIYSDYEVVDGQNVPGIKIGDGLAYVVDLPFIDVGIRNLLLQHINNRVIHITDEERQFWNDKISVRLDAQDQEKIIFFKD